MNIDRIQSIARHQANRRSARPITAAAVTAALLSWGAAHAGPVNCTTYTPGVRVFPEPTASTSFLTFNEFLCGIQLLNATFPHLLEVVQIGSSPEGHPVYNIVMTNENVTTPKQDLLVISSIHGNEVGAREGAARAIEDMLEPTLLGSEPWVLQVLDEFEIHWNFPNPDGWDAGTDIAPIFTRGNSTGRDLNRNQPVKGWISPSNGPLDQPESVALNELLTDGERAWYLGTDNHGQGLDTYAAAGLQIVGEFDFQKSETLARFADGINASMEIYDPSLNAINTLNSAFGLDLGAYHWGTLYDMLGYSASGSVIDYYNTPGVVHGTGFATELTVSQQAQGQGYPALLNQVWVNSIRAINYEMFKQAIDPVDFVFPIGGDGAYVFDPLRVRSDDANGVGFEGNPEHIAIWGQADYDVSRMKFFADINLYSDRPLHKITVGDVLGGAVDLYDFDSIVLNENAMPEAGDAAAWFSLLATWVADGGNLIVTDAAFTALDDLGVLVDESPVSVTLQYVGAVDTFVDTSHPLNQGLRGVASQTFDTVPIGYRFGNSSSNSAPNWRVDRSAWEAAGGTTTGTRGNSFTIYGEVPQGAGRVRILGALLPNPTEDFYHPFGLQNYAVTYTGYTLMENMLVWDNPAQNTSDVDGDGYIDGLDNCPNTINPDQNDVDADGVGDACDNCLLDPNPSQCNSNGDLYGNHCDADLDDNGIVNSFDLNQMRARFGTAAAAPYDIADLNCNGVVNTFDLQEMRSRFGSTPGPTGIAAP